MHHHKHHKYPARLPGDLIVHSYDSLYPSNYYDQQLPIAYSDDDFSKDTSVLFVESASERESDDEQEPDFTTNGVVDDSEPDISEVMQEAMREAMEEEMEAHMEVKREVFEVMPSPPSIISEDEEYIAQQPSEEYEFEDDRLLNDISDGGSDGTNGAPHTPPEPPHSSPFTSPLVAPQALAKTPVAPSAPVVSEPIAPSSPPMETPSEHAPPPLDAPPHRSPPRVQTPPTDEPCEQTPSPLDAPHRAPMHRAPTHRAPTPLEPCAPCAQNKLTLQGLPRISKRSHDFNLNLTFPEIKQIASECITVLKRICPPHNVIDPNNLMNRISRAFKDHYEHEDWYAIKLTPTTDSFPLIDKLHKWITMDLQSFFPSHLHAQLERGIGSSIPHYLDNMNKLRKTLAPRQTHELKFWYVPIRERGESNLKYLERIKDHMNAVHSHKGLPLTEQPKESDHFYRSAVEDFAKALWMGHSKSFRSAMQQASKEFHKLLERDELSFNDVEEFFNMEWFKDSPPPRKKVCGREEIFRRLMPCKE